MYTPRISARRIIALLACSVIVSCGEASAPEAASDDASLTTRPGDPRDESNITAASSDSLGVHGKDDAASDTEDSLDDAGPTLDVEVEGATDSSDALLEDTLPTDDVMDTLVEDTLPTDDVMDTLVEDTLVEDTLVEDTLVEDTLDEDTGEGDSEVLPPGESTCGTASGLAPYAAWPMRSACPTHHARSAHKGPTSNTITWSLPLVRSHQQPVIDAQGRIYIADDLGSLHAISPGGDVLWSASLLSMGPEPTSYTALTTPLLTATDHIVIGTADGEVHALTLAGDTAWSYSAGSAITGDPVVSADGTIVVATDNGMMRWISADGSELGSHAVVPGLNAAPALADHEHVFIGPVSNQVRRLSLSTGAEWTASVGAAPHHAVAIHGAGHVLSAGHISENLFAAKHTKLNAFLPASGALAWSTTIGNATPQSPLIGPDGDIHIPVSAGHQFLTCALVTLTAEGEFLWSYQLAQPCGGDAVADSTGIIYVTGSEGFIGAIDPTGALLWSDTLPETGERTLALGAEGQLYAMSATTGTLYAFSANN